ncbi:hypothetical protein [Marinifilum caeruleilacunae]|uniref:Uncharacterized protein n=1 Tax=Marinifilum caeruleilacunae TaxID=2499076 RepID=A0ABX1WZU7_9BACT|nr:hypothetical protein [Marinifilum caeruleilacunae]NOU61388.1 hypothetical protein [Marinifilum caeruleilacunae]
MKKHIHHFIAAFILLMTIACSNQSRILYVDNVKDANSSYPYKLKQNKAKELIDVKKSDSVFHYHILDTVIEIHQFIRDPQKEFQELKLMMAKLKGRKNIPHFEVDSATFIESEKFEGQTCFSFALESFFEANGINPHPYFDSETLISSKSYQLVLNAIQSESSVIAWKEFKKGKFTLPNEALIALQEQGRRNHGIYYKDGLFYSKNGFSRPARFPDLKSIVKSYKYTDTIWVYTIDGEKLNMFIEKSIE